MSGRFKIFAAFLSLSIVLILIRCAYRIDELSDGYNGPLIHNEGLFVGLEGVMIIVAVFCLAVAQPGPVFGWPARKGVGDETGEAGAAGMTEEPKSSLERVS